jgi:hypothetical protein
MVVIIATKRINIINGVVQPDPDEFTLPIFLDIVLLILLIF